MKVQQEIPLEAYKVRAAVMQTITQAVAQKITAIASQNESSVKMYTAKIQAEAARVGAEADAVKAETEVLKAQADIAIESLKTKIGKITAQAGFEGDLAKAIAQIAAQLAASAMSAVNLNAGVSDGISQTKSIGYDESFRVSVDYSV